MHLIAAKFGKIWSAEPAAVESFDGSGVLKVMGRDYGDSFVVTCKVCRDVAILVTEMADLRQMLNLMKRTVTGQG